MRPIVALTLLTSLAACTPGASAPPSVAAPALAAAPPVATTTSAAIHEAPPPRDDGRLPGLATPTHYAVTLDVDPAQPRFRGQVTIEIDVPRATSQLVLHGRDLHVKEVTATSGSTSLAGTATTRLAHGGVVADELVLSFPELLPAGRASLMLAYDAPFAPDLAGLYRVKEGGRWYAFTQFEATAARRAFPCFDEPGLKATFDLQITTPRGMIAVANTPEAARADGVGDRTRFDFAATPPLSTYLLAFAVGDFDVREGAKSPVPIRLITVKGKAQLGGLALDAAAGLVKELGDYFAIPYPFPKLDIVAVPDFAAGAMENPGLVTFREPLLLIDPSHASVGAKHVQVVVLAHELAHIWFGDLVTMQWWNDLWLNEGFASWMESKAADAWHPEVAERLEAVMDSQGVMDTDALANARAVRQPVSTTSEIEEAFDGISYAKGAAVLSMVEHWLGPDTFQRGVREYLKAHAWKNATSEDLLTALDRASGRNVTGMAATFLDRPGVPTVSVKATCAAGKVTLDLAQSAWHPLGVAAKPSDDVPWSVPFCVREAGGNDTCSDLATARASIGLAGDAKTACPAWVYPNAGAAGYYRYALPEPDARALAGAEGKLSAAERIGLVTNLWAQVRAGTLAPDVLLDALPAFDKETDGHVVREIIAVLYDVDRALVDDATRPAFRAYAAARMKGQKARLGWQPRAGDPDDLAVLRPEVLAFLGDLARDPATLREAGALAKAWLGDPASIDPDVAPVALRLASIQAGPERLDELRAAAKAAKTPLERIASLQAFAAFSDPVTRARAFDLILTDEVKMQDLRYVFTGVFDHEATSRALFGWLETHWDAVLKKVPGSFGAEALVRTIGGVCTTSERDTELAFFQPRVKTLEGTERPLFENVEKATSCSELRAHGSPAVAKFFAKGAKKR
jgi:alanyl aminopeptidase